MPSQAIFFTIVNSSVTIFWLSRSFCFVSASSSLRMLGLVAVASNLPSYRFLDHNVAGGTSSVALITRTGTVIRSFAEFNIIQEWNFWFLCLAFCDRRIIIYTIGSKISIHPLYYLLICARFGHVGNLIFSLPIAELESTAVQVPAHPSITR